VSATVKEINVLLSCPSDADAAARRVQRALEDEWRREAGVLRDLRVQTLHWRQDSANSWSLSGGGQACVNETLLKECDLVIAIFDKDKGSPWTDPESGRDYPSGTVAEIRLGHAASKPVRVYPSSDGRADWAEGPEGRDPELRAILRVLVDELGLKPQPWTDADDLASWARKDLTADLRHGKIKVAWLVVPGRLGVGTEEPVTPRLIPPTPLNYQHREVQDRVVQSWSDGATGDPNTTLVSLVGAGGLGKSFIARDLAREARKPSSGHPAELVLWVESANSVGTTSAYAETAERLGLAVPEDTPDRDAKLAEKLLAQLQEVWWPWLIILDDANVGSLVENNLMPPIQSPVGRVLVTTRENHPWLEEYGYVVRADRFTPEEATRFVRSSRTKLIASASDDQVHRLCEALDHWPLALSIAVATISADRSTIDTWLREFESATHLDHVLSERDAHGYPLMISQVTHMALERAAVGIEPGVVERAAVVAAMLDPMGHAGTVWQHPAIQNWISPNQQLECRRSLPEVLRRLEYLSLINLDDAPWPATTVRMHGLTSRAILEAWVGHDDETEDLAKRLVLALTEPLPADLPSARLATRNVLRVLRRHLEQRLAGDQVQQVLSLLERVDELGSSHSAAQGCRVLLDLAVGSMQKTDSEVLDIRYWLEFFVRSGGRPDEAVAALEALAADRAVAEGATAPGTLLARAELAHCRRLAGGGYQECIRELRQVVDEWVTTEPVPDWRSLRARRYLCYALSRSGQVEEALARWHGLRHDSAALFGDNGRYTLTARNSIALLLGRSQRYRDAAAEFESLVADRGLAQGPHHPGTLISLNNWGSFLFLGGQTQRGLDAVQQSRLGRLAAFGPDTAETLSSHDILSLRLRQAGRLREAGPVLDEALAGRERVNGPGHPMTLEKWLYRARLELDRGHLTAALETCETTLARCSGLSEGHPLISELLNARGLCLWALGRLEEAKEQLAAVLTMRQQSFDPTHRDITRVRFALAQLAGDLDSPDQAVEQLSRLADEVSGRLGPEQPATLRIATALAHWRGRAGQPEAAIADLQEIIDIERRVFEQPHRFTLNAVQDQAHWIGETGSPAPAIAQLEAVLTDRLSTMDEDHPDVYRTRHDLIYWMIRDGRATEAGELATALLADCENTLDPIHPLIPQVRALLEQ
jgi:tetratricopeptide (TPR) repeat protein